MFSVNEMVSAGTNITCIGQLICLKHIFKNAPPPSSIALTCT